MLSIILGLAIVALVGVIVWLVHTNNSRIDQTITSITAIATVRNEANLAIVKAERATFEAAKANTALASEQARADALEEFISHDARETGDDAPLDPDDVAGRLLRFSRDIARANRGAAPTGDPVPAEPGPVLHPNEGEAGSGTA